MKDTTSSRHVGLLIALIAVLSLAIRLPFYKPAITDWDGLNFVQGAMGYYVAHPPGYIGYCVLGMLLDKLLGSITRTYLLIDLACAIAAICLTYPLARRMGFSSRAALLAMIVFSCSFCMLDFSMRITTYTLEAMLATFIALAGLTAIQKRSGAWALLTTIVWAAGGAWRPATTLLLAPLVFYVAIQSDRRWWILALHLLIGVPIVFGWSKADNYFLAARNGFMPAAQPPGLEGQIIMPLYSGFDLSSMQLQRNVQAPLAYHWPSGELLHWLELKTGVNLLPKTVAWPAPSLKHAAVRSVFNFAKMTYFFALALPAAILVPLMWRWRSKLAQLEAGTAAFCAWWFVPPILFFIFCHFGVYGYLSVFLSGAVVLIVGMLADAPAADVPRRLLLPSAMLLSVAGLSVWSLGMPLRSTSRWAGLLNLMIFAHTGPAIAQRYVFSGAAQPDSDDDVSQHYAGLSSDQQLLRQMQRDNLFPNAYYNLSSPSGNQ
jgi:4-amino-4-deoxy-L-arabinose transferase-like glycosyltransferase